MQSNSTNRVFMVRPASFGFNSETAASNFFQSKSENISSEQAIVEFDAMVAGLRAAGVDVRVFEDSPQPPKPDAVFPNNWISVHPGGKVFVYPMWAENRRIERRPEIIEALAKGRTLCDLSVKEREQLYLEGTGSMVMDHLGRKIFACKGPRTSPEMVEHFAQLVGYEPLIFKAVDKEGAAIYHTNVLMAIGTTFSLICLEAITEQAEQTGQAGQADQIKAALQTNARALIEISHEQMNCFAGNMLELEGHDGKLVVMSESAWSSLTAEQIAELSSHAKPIYFPIPTIEHNGGSVRCMIGEIYS